MIDKIKGNGSKIPENIRLKSDQKKDDRAPNPSNVELFKSAVGGKNKDLKKNLKEEKQTELVPEDDKNNKNLSKRTQKNNDGRSVKPQTKSVPELNKKK